MSRLVSSRKKAPAGCLIPFGFIFLASGMAICWFAWSKILAKVAEVRTWIETPCQVLRWEAGVEPGGNVYKVVPVIAYQYEAAGATRTGTVYDAAPATVPTLNELEEKGAAARGGRAVCYVNPANPEQASFLRSGYGAGGAVLAFGLIFGGVGGALMLGGLLSLLRCVTGNPVMASGRSGGCGTLMVPVFFALFAGAGFLVWRLALYGQPDWETIGGRMVEVPAKVLASGVDRSTSSGKNSSPTYKAKIAYEYDFGGRTWRSGWLDFSRGTTSSSNHGKAAEAAARYPVNATPNAWVDPEAPWRAVLEKQNGSRWWLWLFPVVFGGIGILGLLGWLLKVTALGAALFSTNRSADL